MRTVSYIFTILIFVSGKPITARDIDGEFAAFGMGGSTCQNYLMARKKGTGDQLAYMDWVEGYLSAFNLIIDNTYDVMGGRKLNKALAWLDKYCQKYQSHIFANAVAALTVRLHPSRQNLAPNKDTERKWTESGSLIESEETE